MSVIADRWEQAQLALSCLALDPRGLGGAVIRARPGPARDALVTALSKLGLPVQRIHPTIGDAQLFGGVDIAATLAAGQMVRSKGLLDSRQILVLSMAERTEMGLAARLCQHLDTAAGSCLILLDEGATPEEHAPDSLADRLAFHIDLEDVALGDLRPTTLPMPGNAEVHAPDSAMITLATLAARFGIDTLRAPLLALRCARAHATLNGRQTLEEADITAAAYLVYPSRATTVPETQQEMEAPDSNPEEAAETSDIPADILPDGEMLVDAIKAMLPSGLLDQITTGSIKAGTKGTGTGDKHKGNRRGRPLPSRPGRLDGRSRIDLVATLRAAAPWQPIRRRTNPQSKGLLIRSTDLRMRRFEERSDRLLIFTVDASGSAAISRLNEAKGAVELLLAEAYARRDHVALIAFRGTTAELLLPPTRSLVQTKRRLAALPGGGGTPLAAGLHEAAALAVSSKSKGLTPTVVVMTDGRANIALDGSADRRRATAESETLASKLKAQKIASLMIDTSNRPQPALQTLAIALDAPYIPLPRAEAKHVSRVVSGALGVA